MTALSLTSAVIVDVSIVFTLMWFLIRKRHGIPEYVSPLVRAVLSELTESMPLQEYEDRGGLDPAIRC